MLYSLAHAAVDQGIFNLVLTPNYDADHDDHFHMDLTEGRNSVQLFTDDTTSGLDTDGTCGNH